jgi:hypothetical protein
MEMPQTRLMIGWVIGIAAAMQAVPALADADLSSPKAAAQSLYRAMQDADSPAMLNVFYMPNAEDRQLGESLADLLVAGKKLADAAKTQYGADGEAIGAGPVGMEYLGRLQQADEKINGDVATLTVAGQSKPVRFHHSDAGWQLNLADFSGGTADSLPHQVALLSNVAKALSDSAADISAGKYATPQQAQSAIQTRLTRVMIRAATRPATAATTKGSEPAPH